MHFLNSDFQNLRFPRFRPHVRTVSISDPRVIMTGRNVHSNSLHTLIRLETRSVDFQNLRFFVCQESGLDLEEFLEIDGLLVRQESGLDLEEFLEIYGFPRVPGVWPGLRRISRNLRVSACARSLAWT